MLRLSIILLLNFSILTIFTVGELVAGDIYLCVDVENETIITMDKRGLCNNDEREFGLMGLSDEETEGMYPVAEFLPDEDCKTADTKLVKLGFDNDGDNVLDEEELWAISSECPIESSDNGE